jgi:hypothetical protein
VEKRFNFRPRSDEAAIGDNQGGNKEKGLKRREKETSSVTPCGRATFSTFGVEGTKQDAFLLCCPFSAEGGEGGAPKA